MQRGCTRAAKDRHTPRRNYIWLLHVRQLTLMIYYSKVTMNDKVFNSFSLYIHLFTYNFFSLLVPCLLTQGISHMYLFIFVYLFIITLFVPVPCLPTRHLSHISRSLHAHPDRLQCRSSSSTGFLTFIPRHISVPLHNFVQVHASLFFYPSYDL